MNTSRFVTNQPNSLKPTQGAAQLESLALFTAKTEAPTDLILYPEMTMSNA